jgi:hypothetical protein
LDGFAVAVTVVEPCSDGFHEHVATLEPFIDARTHPGIALPRS